jgi:hypothetical protein
MDSSKGQEWRAVEQGAGRIGPFRRVLAELNADTAHPPVTCVVSDVVMGFSMDAAKELGLTYVQLWTTSAISYPIRRWLEQGGHRRQLGHAG